MACGRCASGQSSHSLRVWTLLAVGATALEAMALRNGNQTHTLSHIVRSTTRCHTRTGRTAFSFGWGAFSLWFLLHITRSPHNKRIEL